MKRFGKEAKDIRDAIVKMDTSILNSEYVELLTKLIPSENEEKAMDKYNKEYSDAKPMKAKPKLLPEEKFLLEVRTDKQTNKQTTIYVLSYSYTP